jgi:hypothetical protein
MKRVILLITIILVFTALIFNSQQEGISNSFFAYFSYVINSIAQNYFIYILGFIVLIIIFFHSIKFDRSYSIRKNYFLSIFQIFNVLITAFFLSYVVLLFIAFIELNIFSILININPKILSVITDKNTIVNNLKRNNHPPEIIASDNAQNSELSKIASAITGNNSFYGKYILPSIPRFLTLSIKESSFSMLLVDDTLIVSKLNPDDLQEISPSISHSLVQQYFSRREIKSYPNIAIMKKDEYQKYREKDFRKGTTKIKEEIGNYQKQIASTTQSIEEDKNKLLYNKNIIDKSTSEYKKCLANGDYSLSYCKDLLNKSGVSKLKKEVADLNKKLLLDQGKLKDHNKYHDFYVTLEKTLKLAEGYISQEYGAFTPKDTISVAFNTEDQSHTIADYFETLTHEYLHYASYISDDKKLKDSFFEEGLTEYFARQIIKDDLNVSTNLGYPVYAKVFSQITKRIIESDLADIYFSKDQDRLERLLGRVYGDGFYKNNRILFLNIQYASNSNQVLKFANEIMKKIGGDPLSKKDLLSTSSE